MQIEPVNFRDIGGIETATGHLKKNTFFRSGQLINLTAATSDFLANTCQIKTIYDFRSTKETEQMPDTPIKAITWQHLDILADATANYASMNKMVENSGDTHQHMLETYEQLVTSHSAHVGYHTFMMDLIEQPQPIIFHCFAGKDRTGFAAALILKAAGASDEAIMSDYLRTNELRKEANQEIVEQHRDEITDYQVQQLLIALQVAPEYLQHAKTVLIANYGSFDNYLQTGLNLPADYIAKFQQLYVES